MQIARAHVCLMLLLAVVAGCATVPYRYDPEIEQARTLKLREGEPQIERGKPKWLLDGAGHYVFSLPTKLILWSWKADNHKISPDTEEALRRYVAENGLKNVKVRLNEYAPGDEYRRLFHNKDVGGFWRYTLGILSVTIYTILPDRLFAGLIGGDSYNPYTNTIHIYSDHPAILLHEPGHAKDFAKQDYKGSYAAIAIVPFVCLHHEGEATGDVIGYYIDKGYTAEQKRAYKILYPAYGTYVGGEGAQLFAGPITYAGTAIGALVGHVAGRIAAGKVDDNAAQPAPGQGKPGEGKAEAEKPAAGRDGPQKFDGSK